MGEYWLSLKMSQARLVENHPTRHDMCSLACAGVALPCTLSNIVTMIFPGLRSQCYASIPSVPPGIVKHPGPHILTSEPGMVVVVLEDPGPEKTRGKNRLCVQSNLQRQPGAGNKDIGDDLNLVRCLPIV